MKNIIWLASYPKSGNTWLRILINNLFSKKEEPIQINSLNDIPISSSRSLFDHYSGVSSSNLTNQEIEVLQPKVYRLLSQDNTIDIYFKVHDYWRLNVKNQPIFPPDITKGVIYLVRNPLDVLISFSNHFNSSYDHALTCINNSDFGLGGKTGRLDKQLYQKVSSWSIHIKSWLQDSSLPIYFIRYEDMLNNPYKEFSGVIDFLGKNFRYSEIKKAVDFSHIEELKKQEKQFGFREKPINSSSFFNSGSSGNWKGLLSEEQVLKVVNHNEKYMREFGYLT